MKEWKDYKNIQCILEYAVIGVIGICIIAGIVCEIFVARGNALHYIEDISASSMTLLQIQGSLATLTLAIIALLAGNIFDSYKGVSISAYILEEKPKLLKQKRVIVIEFMILFLNVFCHIMGWYNMVFLMFFSSLLIVVVSIQAVYFIFKGNLSLEKDIDGYIDSIFLQKNKLLEFSKSFVANWKNIVKEQTNHEFAKYESTFNQIIRSLLEENQLAEINNIQVDIALFLLESESYMNRKRGIIFVYNRYENLWLWIVDNQGKAKELIGNINLLSCVAREWYMAMDLIQAEEIEEILKWRFLADNVLKVSAWIGYTNDKVNQEQVALNRIARTFGGYIKRQKSKGNLVESRRWESFVGHRLDINAYEIPEASILFFQEAKALLYFNFIRNLILNYQVDIVKNSFFLDGLINLYDINCRAELVQILMVHIYMYYIAFRESVTCVDEEVKKEIRRVLLDKFAVNSCDNLIYNCKELLNNEIELQLEVNLGEHELYPKHARSKAMIMDSVVQDYYLFFVLYVAHQNYDNQIISKAIDTEKFYSYLRDDSYDRLVEVFLELIQLFRGNGDRCEENHDCKENLKIVHEMLAVFLEDKKLHFKEKTKLEGENQQKKYEICNIKEKIASEINLNITERFEELFKSILCEEDDWNIQEKVKIYSCVDYTEYLDDKRKIKLMSNRFSVFMDWLSIELKKRGFVSEIELTNKFKEDNDLKLFLKNMGVEVLMGSYYVFSARDRNNRHERIKFLDEFKKNYVPSAEYGLAIKKDSIRIRLDRVNTYIYSPELEDIKFDKNIETGRFKHVQSGVTLEFDENELREHIRNERKIVEVVLHVSIAIKTLPAGILITRERG